MRQTTLSNVRRNAAVAAIASIVMVSTSNAAVYSSKWDPIFDTDFSANVGWSGSATVTVADGCVVANTTQDVGEGSCTSGSLDAVTLNFYDTLGNVDPFDDVQLGSVTWPFAGPVPLLSQVRVDSEPKVNGISLLGTLSGNTGDIFGATTYAIALDFVIDFVNDSDPLFTGPILQLTQLGCEFGCVYSSATAGENQPISEWSLVPEPTSLLLAGIALAALRLSRRRHA